MSNYRIIVDVEWDENDDEDEIQSSFIWARCLLDLTVPLARPSMASEAKEALPSMG